MSKERFLLTSVFLRQVYGVLIKIFFKLLKSSRDKVKKKKKKLAEMTDGIFLSKTSCANQSVLMNSHRS